MANIRSVVFDLDGTLIDVSSMVVRRLGEVIHASGAEAVPPEELGAAVQASRNARPSLARWARERITAGGGLAPPAAEIFAELTNVAVSARPDEHVLSAVASVAETHDVALVTNGRATLQRAKLRAAGLSALFPKDLVFVSGELGVRKPDARIFRMALERLGDRAESVMFVGDDEREDIAGARAVGMPTCRVAEVGVSTEADHRVRHVRDLMEVLTCGT